VLSGPYSRIKIALTAIGGLAGLAAVAVAYADGWDSGSRATNEFTTQAENATPQLNTTERLLGGISNTRHNLTQWYSSQQFRMDDLRNNYYEVCVYCHTPHGANSTAAAPLWNRTVIQRSYTLYGQDVGSTAQQDITQPGPNSLTCLSCHDGATAIDSVINMPTQLTGSYRAGYSASQESTVDQEFLNEWAANNQLGMPGPTNLASSSPHAGFNPSTGSACLTCHNPVNPATPGTPDFRPFVIGSLYQTRTTNPSVNFLAKQYNRLDDDHPVGVRYPTAFGPGVDYNEPNVKAARIAYFDLNNDGHADPNEIRLYDSGDGYEVECGSCHDPHGVLAEGTNNLIPSFLRVGARFSDTNATISGNRESQLCLTCHVK
jgi:hypothetical protein